MHMLSAVQRVTVLKHTETKASKVQVIEFAS